MERRRMMMERLIVPPTDLSMVDNAGNTRSARTTANCYLVHSAGKYKLPLVYGNAIKNGVVNTQAFNPNGTSSSTFLKPFVNHAGSGITGPWITKSGSGVDAGMGLVASSAQLIWQDVNGLITEVGVEGDFLTFTVGSFNQGNAVIAVKNSSGTILWSWHIWATNETLSSTTKVMTDASNQYYYVAQVNLGWVPTGGDGKQGYCPFYQWGRKDPFIPSNGSGNTNKTVYVGSGVPSSGIAYQASSYATIGTTIQNPWVHYYNSSTGFAFNTQQRNLWNTGSTSRDIIYTGTKSIYDPCPPDFYVPPSYLFAYMGGWKHSSDNVSVATKTRSMSTWDSTNKGAIWNKNISGTNLWYPASGVRGSASGNLTKVGESGRYWTNLMSSYNSNKTARTLFLGSSNWEWQNSAGAVSMPIRPVLE